MPEISTYNFSLKEVAELLVKEAEITEGKWIIGVNIGVNIGTMGPDPEHARPGIMALIEAVNLRKIDDDADVDGIMVDASKIES